ncbi:unnamed protein product [Miscanthus lutarioriparius]|uniref:Uncharacterized protein n=1 Tax=Miscanthus lutarioriparius TaxID=422564 RepID=A0A811R280_9POAL|nr:unnamed protein product [Miscanthus lutarioriparius]
MARAAVVAMLAVAVLLACLPPAAASSYRGAAALRQLETAAPMDTAQGLREKADVAKGKQHLPINYHQNLVFGMPIREREYNAIHNKGVQ